jgi:hypothetical protein
MTPSEVSVCTESDILTVGLLVNPSSDGQVNPQADHTFVPVAGDSRPIIDTQGEGEDFHKHICTVAIGYADRRLGAGAY